jgi:nuclear GTP-binding protein
MLSADSSRRAFFKEFVKIVEAADVIIEVLDARDPLATRCMDVERYVRKSGAAKRLILLLNKIGECLQPSTLMGQY